jgi:Sigma-70, region 4
MTDAAEASAPPASVRQLRPEFRHLPVAHDWEIDAATAEDRPRTRADCVAGVRPCPYVGCGHHLYLRVSKDGIVRLNFPGLEPGDLAETCTLDVAERGGLLLEEVGTVMGVTRERVRQIEEQALAKLAGYAADDARSLREFWADEDGEPG